MAAAVSGVIGRGQHYESEVSRIPHSDEGKPVVRDFAPSFGKPMSFGSETSGLDGRGHCAAAVYMEQSEGGGRVPESCLCYCANSFNMRITYSYLFQ